MEVGNFGDWLHAPPLHYKRLSTYHGSVKSLSWALKVQKKKKGTIVCHRSFVLPENSVLSLQKRQLMSLPFWVFCEYSSQSLG